MYVCLYMHLCMRVYVYTYVYVSALSYFCVCPITYGIHTHIRTHYMALAVYPNKHKPYTDVHSRKTICACTCSNTCTHIFLRREVRQWLDDVNTQSSTPPPPPPHRRPRPPRWPVMCSPSVMTSWHIKAPSSWVVVPFVPACFSVCVCRVGFLVLM